MMCRQFQRVPNKLDAVHVGAVLLVGLLEACGDGRLAAPGPDEVEVECGAPLTEFCEPTDIDSPVNYEHVYGTVLEATCGGVGGDCHQNSTSNGAKSGGLVFGDMQETYDLLLNSHREYVVPYFPECSRLVVRMTTDDELRRMPRGGDPSTQDICTVVRWIELGAQF